MPARNEPLPPESLDGVDRQLINDLQAGIPLVERPFAEAAANAGIAEDDVVARLARMREIGAISRFGPFLDAEAMGGAFCLCAMEVPDDRFESVAERVNAYPEVAHNYERDHRLNMWFVLACEREGLIGATADRIEAETGLEVLRFPKLREFYVGFRVAA